MESQLESLPSDIYNIICSYTKSKEMLSLARASKKLYAIIERLGLKYFTGLNYFLSCARCSHWNHGFINVCKECSPAFEEIKKHCTSLFMNNRKIQRRLEILKIRVEDFEAHARQQSKSLNNVLYYRSLERAKDRFLSRLWTSYRNNDIKKSQYHNLEDKAEDDILTQWFRYSLDMDKEESMHVEFQEAVAHPAFRLGDIWRFKGLQNWKFVFRVKIPLSYVRVTNYDSGSKTIKLQERIHEIKLAFRIKRKKFGRKWNLSFK